MNQVNINISNYELYVLDYLENSLEEDLMESMELFLTSNPAIADEIEGLINIKLEIDENKIADPNCLKKNIDSLPHLEINNDNFDEKYLTIAEGGASNADIEEMRVFMNYNSHKILEAKILDYTILEPDLSVEWKIKDQLKQLEHESATKIDLKNFDEYCIAYHEGVLNPQSRNELIDYIGKNTQRNEDLETYSKIHLTPDYSIIYEGKNQLRKKAAVFTINHRFTKIASIAAVFIILIGVTFKLNMNDVSTFSKEKTVRNAMARLSVDMKKNSEIQLSSQNSVEITKSQFSKRENNDIEHVQPRRSNIIKQTNNDIELTQPVFIVFNQPNQSTTEGYYKVSLSNDNFLDRNNDLKLKSIEKIRGFFGINTDRLNIPEDKLTMWDMAEVGISMYNNLTESNVLITRNSSGEKK